MGMLTLLIVAVVGLVLVYLLLIVPRLKRRTPRDRELRRDPGTSPKR